MENDTLKQSIENEVKCFLEDHSSDDIVHATTTEGMKYFGLSNEKSLLIASFVFKAIRQQKKTEGLS
jgi:hypothetical protein